MFKYDEPGAPPSIDACLGELLHEEQCLATQATIQQAISTGPMTAAHVA